MLKIVPFVSGKLSLSSQELTTFYVESMAYIASENRIIGAAPPVNVSY